MRSRHLISTMALCGLAVAGLGAAAGGPERPDTRGVSQDSSVTAVVPEQARKRPNPQEATTLSLAKGKQIFASQCTMCHGASGDGKGDLVERLQLTMPNFTDPEHQNKRTDGELFYILTHGHGRMRGEGERLDDATKWNLVNFIRSLSLTD